MNSFEDLKNHKDYKWYAKPDSPLRLSEEHSALLGMVSNVLFELGIMMSNSQVRVDITVAPGHMTNLSDLTYNYTHDDLHNEYIRSFVRWDLKEMATFSLPVKSNGLRPLLTVHLFKNLKKNEIRFAIHDYQYTSNDIYITRSRVITSTNRSALIAGIKDALLTRQMQSFGINPWD